MSQTPEFDATASDHSSSPFAFSRPVPSVDDPRTVVSPERRGLTGSGSDVLRARSSVWNRLFPAESAADQPDSPTGLQLDHFVIQERIGAGGMGAVFRALDTRLQRIVALKILGPAHSHDPSSVQRFQNEARAAARLDHDNIARVYYFGEDKGLHFIAFEFITGTNVRDLIRQKGRLDVADAVNYTLQIVSALRHTSAAGVVHRDIKPSNIIITPSGRAKLVDLGLARKGSADSAGDLTLAGTTLGTFDYISPEQAKDPRNVDVRSDIYSLGCTLYHMLTGEPPYPEGTITQKLLDHHGKEPPDPARKNSRVSPDLSLIVRKMMASDPRHRYSTPDLLIRDLMLVAGSMGLRGINSEGLVWMSARSVGARFWERHLGWMTTAVLLLLVVGVLQRFPAIGQRWHPLVSAASRQDGTPDDSQRSVRVGDQRTESVDSPQRTEPESPSRAAGEPEPSGIAHAGESDDSLPRPNGRQQPAEPRDGEPVAVGPRSPIESNPEADDGVPSDTIQDADPPAGTAATNDSPTQEIDRPSTAPEVPTVESGKDDPRKVRAGQTASPNEGEGTQHEPDPRRLPLEDYLPIAPPPIAIVGVNGEPVQTYETLEAACRDAEDGSIIELKFNDRRIERPLRITNKKLTIRAARNYRPLIEFAPADIPAEGYQTRMITMVGGSVSLINVDLTVKVRADIVTEQWALFSARHPEQIRLRGVTVSFENAESERLNPLPAIVELLPGARQDPSGMNMKMMMDDSAREPIEIEMTESLLRGYTHLIVSQQTDSGRFLIRDSVVALEGSLLNVQGSYEMIADNARIQLNMEHVTCLLGENLIKVESNGDFSPRQLLPVSVSTRNNIFAPRAGTPLISMNGNNNPEDLRRMLTWSGENNFYDRYTVFWSIQGASDFEELDFDGWKSEWDAANNDIAAQNAPIIWKNSWRYMDFSRLTTRNVILDHVADNPAFGGADHYDDAGANLSKVPYGQRLPSRDATNE
jgi:eukaryotic-like serine/threonine-protein kinase